MHKDDVRNWVVFSVLAFGIFILYQVFIYGPDEAHRRAVLKAESAAHAAEVAATAPGAPAPGAFLPLAQAQAGSPRVKVDTPSLAGSIALRGARIDDLYLKRYRLSVDPKSPQVELFKPEGAEGAWFAETGWTSPVANMPGIPNDATLWTAPAGATLTPTTPLVLTYDNGAGLKFTRTIAVDPNYMFSVDDAVTNTGTTPVALAPSGVVAQVGKPTTAASNIVHEGAIGMLGHNLVLDKYADWKKKTAPTTVTSTGGWLGITEKYWLAALIPDQTAPITATFEVLPGTTETYVARYAGTAQTVAPGASLTEHSRLFAGAKVVPLLRNYEYSGTPPKYYWSSVPSHPTDIPRFDQAVDWGHLFFFTQPLFDLLELFTLKIGSIGLAILVLTVVVRGIFFPLANKSYESMSKMRKIAPEVEGLKKKYEGDQTKIQSETMALYQREKINPLMGCLPMLIQIPVFYSLYKVLTVTIEMRQAPFFGWIHDLSARDPSTIWTLFGLIHWNPAMAPLIGGLLDGQLHIGLLPIIYGFTMWLSTSMSPPAGDPTTQTMMKFLPLVFTFTLAQVTVGLLIYWTWSNLLTILQQYVIMHRFQVENPIDNLFARFAQAQAKALGVSEAPASEEAVFTTEALEAARVLFARQASFVMGAVAIDGLPEPDLPEVAFAGRSNVGKSSLINALVDRHRLARASNEPGRTREVNFFLLDERLRLVDLPGYGFARASKTTTSKFQNLGRAYLRGRPNLARVYLLIDARHGLKSTDAEALDALDKAAVSYQIVLTKADKLKPAQVTAITEATLKAISRRPAAFPRVVATSSETKLGLAELKAEIALAALPAV